MPLPTRDALKRFVAAETIASGQRARARRKSLGLTLEAVEAIHPDLRRQTVSRIERGELNPRDDLKVLLSLVLQCDLEDIWPNATRKQVLRAVA